MDISSSQSWRAELVKFYANGSGKSNERGEKGDETYRKQHEAGQHAVSLQNWILGRNYKSKEGGKSDLKGSS